MKSSASSPALSRNHTAQPGFPPLPPPLSQPFVRPRTTVHECESVLSGSVLTFPGLGPLSLALPPQLPAALFPMEESGHFSFHWRPKPSNVEKHKNERESHA